MKNKIKLKKGDEVIVLSGKDKGKIGKIVRVIPDIRKVMNLGADDYITKPFEETELLDAIESRIKKNDFFKVSSSVDMIEGMVSTLDEIDGVQKLSTKERLKHYKKKDTIIHECDTASVVYQVR